MYRTRKNTKLYQPEKARKQYATSATSCPFCSRDVKIVEENKSFMVVENRYAYNYWEFMDVEEHLMIVPKRHIESIAELDEKERFGLVELIAKYEDKGYNVYLRERKNVVKTIPHQHTHLIKTKNRRPSFFVYLRRPYIIFTR